MKLVRVITHAPHLMPKGEVVQNPRPAIIQKSTKDVPWLWAQLHLRAIDHIGGDDSAWMSEFGNRIPCGQCRIHWKRMLEEAPPDWGDYFGWTVARHNEINAKLGKPLLSYDEARARWLQNGLVKTQA